MNKRITNIIMGLLVVLLMGVLVGCPTEAPKPKDKSGDGGGDPLPEISISFSHIGSHEIVADVTANIALDDTKEVAFVITDSSTKPTLPANVDAITTDGFISRKITKGDDPRKVYMAQLGTDLPSTTVSIGEINKIDKLHAAFMNADTEYYLHTFYTKQGSGEVTHTSKKFRTTVHRNSGDAFDGVKTIELKLGKENLNLIFDWGVPIKTTITLRFPNGFAAGFCDPASDLVPADCTGSGTVYKATLFGNQSLFIVKGFPTSTDGNSAIGLWRITNDGATYTFTVKTIDE